MTTSVATPRRLAILAHWDPDAELRPYVLEHLRALRGLAVRVVLVSTAGLGRDAIARASTVAHEVISLPNVGYDFAMWRHVLLREDLAAWDEVVLTNSSVFGPVTPLAVSFRAMHDEPCDLWGMTENTEIAWHLQSYFLVARQPLLASSAFRAFWQSVLPYRDKWQVIRSYEIGLTRWVLDEGFRARSYVSVAMPAPGQPDPVAALRGTERNPTLAHPVELLRVGMPYVKVELLRSNPMHADLAAVRRAIAATAYPAALLR